MQPDLINRVTHYWFLNASSRAGSGSVKGALARNLCVGQGIYLPLTGSDQTLSWRLRPLMGQLKQGQLKTIINFLKFC